MENKGAVEALRNAYLLRENGDKKAFYSLY